MIIKQDSVAPLKSLYVPILSTLIAPWTACNLVFEINRNNIREQIQHHQGLLLPLNSMGRVSKLEMRADGGASRKKSAHKCRRHKRWRFDPWVGKIPWRKAWQPTPYSCLENPMDRGPWQASTGSHRVGYDWRNLPRTHAQPLKITFLLSASVSLIVFHHF
jgi:hypothetical protein